MGIAPRQRIIVILLGLVLQTLTQGANATNRDAIQYAYTGREPDDSGLMYFRGRYMDPSLGRFSQSDPIGLAGGINDYTYVGNRPVNATDPSGLSASDSEVCSPLCQRYAYYRLPDESSFAHGDAQRSSLGGLGVLALSLLGAGAVSLVADAAFAGGSAVAAAAWNWQAGVYGLGLAEGGAAEVSSELLRVVVVAHGGKPIGWARNLATEVERAAYGSAIDDLTIHYLRTKNYADLAQYLSNAAQGPAAKIVEMVQRNASGIMRDASPWIADVELHPDATFVRVRDAYEIVISEMATVGTVMARAAKMVGGRPFRLCLWVCQNEVTSEFLQTMPK